MGKVIRRVGVFVGYFRSLHIPVYASHAGFFIVLSVFPSLVLLLSLLRYTGLQVDHLTELLSGVLPKALLPAAEKLIVSTYRSTTGTLVSLSAVTALWSASRGFLGLCTGLNCVYGVKESRGYFRTRLMCVVYTFGFLLVLLLTLILQVFGSSVSQWLPVAESGAVSLLERVLDLRFFLLLILQTALFTAIYVVLPNRKNRFPESLPGALLASMGWLVFSDLYSVYVEHFKGMSVIYGSVYAVALSMLWLYFCVSIIFYGGAVNRFLSEDEKEGADT